MGCMCQIFSEGKESPAQHSSVYLSIECFTIWLQPCCCDLVSPPFHRNRSQPSPFSCTPLIFFAPCTTTGRHSFIHGRHSFLHRVFLSSLFTPLLAGTSSSIMPPLAHNALELMPPTIHGRRSFKHQAFLRSLLTPSLAGTPSSIMPPLATVPLSSCLSPSLAGLLLPTEIDSRLQPSQTGNPLSTSSSP